MSADLKTQKTESREVLRAMLIRLHEETRQRIKDLRRDQEQESESEPADEMDSARTTAEIETHAGLIARAEEKLRYLDEAFVRLDAGKYGLCLECGEAIPLERLMAIPFASYCVGCQQKLNRTRGGWGEGTTIPPYDHQWTLPEEMEEPAGREYRATDLEEQLTVHDLGSIGTKEPRNPAVRDQLPHKGISRRKK